jgi:hypothetical protein
MTGALTLGIPKVLYLFVEGILIIFRCFSQIFSMFRSLFGEKDYCVEVVDGMNEIYISGPPRTGTWLLFCFISSVFYAWITYIYPPPRIHNAFLRNLEGSICVWLAFCYFMSSTNSKRNVPK